MYGAQCRPGRTAISKLTSRIEPEVLGRESLGDDQRESADVGRRVPAAGDPPALGLLHPVDDLLQ